MVKAARNPANRYTRGKSKVIKSHERRVRNGAYMNKDDNHVIIFINGRRVKEFSNWRKYIQSKEYNRFKVLHIASIQQLPIRERERGRK